MSTIVVDGLSALRGGGETYLLHLLTRRPEQGVRIVALLPPRLAERIGQQPGLETIVPLPDGHGLARRLLWQSGHLPRLLERLHADVLYCPGGMLATRRLGGCRSAVAFRNMLPFAPRERARFPLGRVRFRLWLLGRLQSASFRDADLVIFVSEHARRVIDAACPHRRGRSVVIPHGVGDGFRCPAPRPSGAPEHYVLYVSILDPYKAQVEVVRAWARLRGMRSTPERLVLLGPTDTNYAHRVRAEIAALGLQQEVLIRGETPYAELPGWYQHARVNLFASSCENCPNILLEALAAGRPVLSSNAPPMPEFGADAARYFDPWDPQNLAEVLAGCLDDDALLASLSAAARRRSLDFDWGQASRRTWDALAELAER